MSEHESEKPDQRPPLPPMDRTAISWCDLSEQGHDLEYWLSRTPEERIAAVEIMRQIVYGTDPVNDRIQRVLEIVDRPPR